MTLFDSLPQPLSVGEDIRAIETALAAKIQKGDEAAANELVMRNMREAMLYTRRVSQNIEQGQLMSLCYEALLRNAKRFDPTRQRFFAFAKPGLRGALYRHYHKETGPTLIGKSTELPSRNGKSPAHYSYDGVTGAGERAMAEYEPVCENQIVEPDMESIFTRDQWELVRPVVKQKCSEQEQMVLTMTYLSGLNFQEVGDLLGVTRSAIQRTHWRAIKKLRMELGRRKQLFS
jgi:RNA polymerase sigma factor (sigma-70 family)